MSVFTRVDSCPTCHQPVYKLKDCTCTHAVTAHAFGTRKGESVRTYCNSYGCDCRLFMEVGLRAGEGDER